MVLICIELIILFKNVLLIFVHHNFSTMITSHTKLMYGTAETKQKQCLTLHQLCAICFSLQKVVQILLYKLGNSKFKKGYVSVKYLDENHTCFPSNKKRNWLNSFVSFFHSHFLSVVLETYFVLEPKFCEFWKAALTCSCSTFIN